MDTYENENLGFDPIEIPQEPEAGEVAAEQAAFAQPATEEPAPAVQEPVAQPVQPKKESPFANSPYVKAEPVQRPVQNGYAFPGNTPKAPKQKKPGKKSGLRVAAFLLSAALVVVASCSLGINLSENRWQREIQSLTDRYDSKIEALEKQIEAMGDTGNSVSGSPAASDGLTPGQVYARNKNAVVAISCVTQYSQFGQVGSSTSSGSGFVLTEDGYVITNFHVIENATVVNVITYDGTEYRAMVKGYDANNDLAVLKIQAEGLQTVTVGKSGDLIIGDMVVAIGNPLGELTSTQTVGYISGKDRDVSTDGTIINMLQTDAAINPGNSGGPLFNMKGEVVGITTAKYSGTTSSGASIEGIGFAIPMDDVVRMIEDIMAHGYVTGPYLGVSVSNIPEAQASYYGRGALVAEVVPGYCAARAGVQVGDLIVMLGGYKVDSVSDLTRALRNFEAGETVTMTVLRQGREMILSLTLDEKPNGSQAVPDENGEIPMPSEGNYDDWYKYFYGQEPDPQP
jgi:serine protease Do